MKCSEFNTRRLAIRPLKKSDYKAWVDFYTTGHSKKNEVGF